MEPHSAFKSKETPTHATICMNPEDMMLSEIRESERTNTGRFHVYEVTRVIQLTDKKKKWWFPGTEGEGETGNYC